MPVHNIWDFLPRGLVAPICEFAAWYYIHAFSIRTQSLIIFGILQHLGKNNLRFFARHSLLSFPVKLPVRPLFLVFLINVYTFSLYLLTYACNMKFSPVIWLYWLHISFPPEFLTLLLCWGILSIALTQRVVRICATGWPPSCWLTPFLTQLFMSWPICIIDAGCRLTTAWVSNSGQLDWGHPI